MKENLIKLAIILTIVLIIIYNFFIKDKFNNDSNLVESYMFENQLSSLTDTNDINKINSNDQIQSTTESQNKIKVYITGEVHNPGVYELNENSRIEDAIEVAGGTSNDANLRDVNLAFILEDAMKIYIPNKNEDSSDSQIVSTNDFNSQDSSPSGISSSSSKININKASISELEKIPGVGPSTAQKIITYREEHGKFSTIDDIKNVSGIGSKKFENIKEYITT